MFYGLHVKPLDNGKFEASSPDLPECVFDADSIDEATELATEMMPGAMELFYRQKRRAIPLPTPRFASLPAFKQKSCSGTTWSTTAIASPTWLECSRYPRRKHSAS